MALALLVVASTAAPAADEEKPAGAVLELVTLSGEPAPLVLEEGGPALVVHFWATWCPSCVEELGVLDRAAARCAEAGVRVVAVDVGEDEDSVRAYLEQHRISLPVRRDPRGRVWRSVSGVGLPVNLFWTGRERRVEVGPGSAGRWRTVLAELGCGS